LAGFNVSRTGWRGSPASCAASYRPQSDALKALERRENLAIGRILGKDGGLEA
jgi:hypothetical protein